MDAYDSQHISNIRRRTRIPSHYWKYFLIVPRVLKHKKQSEEENERIVVNDMSQKKQIGRRSENIKAVEIGKGELTV